MARRLRKKRIAIILLTFTAIVGWTTHSCVSRCTSASDKNKAADSLPKVHINDSISNALTEGKEYHEMDSVIERYLKRWEINGAQLVITRNDSLLYARGFGMADKERGIRMEPNMLMRFASVSKLITAVGIMKLQEMKKLKLNEKVFGEKGILRDTVYNNSIKDKRYYDITVEQLLRHQAGFNNYAGDPVSSTRYIMMQNHLKTPPDHPTLLKILLKRHLGYTPGEGKCYSNLGYMILSMIIEKKSGMKYENFMQKYVLHPAGCYDMHIAGTYLKDRRPNETKYYMHQGSIPVYEYNNSGRLVEKCYGDTDLPRLSGAGAWCGSAAELSRFIASIDGLPHPVVVQTDRHRFNRRHFEPVADRVRMNLVSHLGTQRHRIVHIGFNIQFRCFVHGRFVIARHFHLAVQIPFFGLLRPGGTCGHRRCDQYDCFFHHSLSVTLKSISMRPFSAAPRLRRRHSCRNSRPRYFYRWLWPGTRRSA